MRNRLPISRRLRGFTLIEAAIVTAIVGIGIVAVLELLAAGSMANRQSGQLTMAMNLAANITEMLQGKPYDTLHATYDNKVYGEGTTTVVDARGNELRDAAGNVLFPNWRQAINIEYVDPGRLTFALPEGQESVTARVTVTIFHHDRGIYVSRWIVAAPE